MQVITGVSDAELNNFDVIEGSEYERVRVEVVRMVSVRIIISNHNLMQFWGNLWILMMQDNSEKMRVETYVWVNKDDPSMYGEWDFEVGFLLMNDEMLLPFFLFLCADC